MMRQSSRNQRNKKLKMKHALQLFVLLAISIWLLYQLKHTFDKKHSVDATINNPDDNPITTNDQRMPEKTTKLGRKDLPQYIENSNSNSERDNDVDEEDEDKDTELEQLLEDVEARENGQEDSEDNGDDRDDEIVDGEYNGEEDEEGNTDGDANDSTIEVEEKSTQPSANASSSVQSDSASNQTVSVSLSTQQANNSTGNVEVKEGKSAVQDGLHAIQGRSVEATNETNTDAIPHLSTKVEGSREEIKEG